MQFKILGSGGAIPTPRPFCQCKLCTLARTDSKYKRNSSCAFLEDLNLLIDCPEDIADSLNKHKIKVVEKLFITHWHPDHTFGLRVLLEANYDFIERKAKNCIIIYIAKKVYTVLKAKYPAIDYYVDVLKVAKLHFVDDQETIEGPVSITFIGYSGKGSDYYGLLAKENNKRLLYVPCDTLHFSNYLNFNNLDILIQECGIFSEQVKTELSFPNLINRLKEIKPKQTILTHIEEIELNKWGLDYLDTLKNKYNDINFIFAHDGLTITI